ncbi:response regulator [Epilithonimonas mollis]|uniref:Response regulator receiver domain-containing protein n=1 Tax=Epilithonimonas mollis TaxID=216903 RepID=A0A1M6UPK8_9FLAO|nr:response regulator [Epilithonimonas mollis]SHK71108.1 Response regulator receiver domain-containing protein [Epilithonimonas mollis]
MTKKTILIFDDDLALLDFAQFLFEEQYYSVEVCSSTQNVIQKVEEIRPDIIFMDNWIPTIGGIQATRLLKSHLQFKTIPVIYMTTNKDIENLARQALADDYISKPFSIEQLESLTSKHLGICH